MSIIEVASEEAQRRGVQVTAVHLKIGDLSGVACDALLSAYELAREGSPLAESSLCIERVPISIFCPTCDSERPAISVQNLCCQNCGTFPSRVVSGREMEVVALEVAD